MLLESSIILQEKIHSKGVTRETVLSTVKSFMVKDLSLIKSLISLISHAPRVINYPPREKIHSKGVTRETVLPTVNSFIVKDPSLIKSPIKLISHAP
jgi:hypothetical protein